jgi:preprotein translocase subunit SecA
LEDDLLIRYGIDNPMFKHDADGIQRVVEGQNLDIREFLRKYESVIEGQRLLIQRKRQEILTGATPCASELERLVQLTTIDDLWSEYLAAIADLRSGVHWVSWGGRDPLHEYLTTVDDMFVRLERQIEKESVKRLAEAQAGGFDLTRRGATWTYLTTDRPFGNISERIIRGLLRKMNIATVAR